MKSGVLVNAITEFLRGAKERGFFNLQAFKKMFKTMEKQDADFVNMGFDNKDIEEWLSNISEVEIDAVLDDVTLGDYHLKTKKIRLAKCEDLLALAGTLLHEIGHAKKFGENASELFRKKLKAMKGKGHEEGNWHYNTTLLEIVYDGACRDGKGKEFWKAQSCEKLADKMWTEYFPKYSLLGDSPKPLLSVENWKHLKGYSKMVNERLRKPDLTQEARAKLDDAVYNLNVLSSYVLWYKKYPTENNAEEVIDNIYFMVNRAMENNVDIVHGTIQPAYDYFQKLKSNGDEEYIMGK